MGYLGQAMFVDGHLSAYLDAEQRALRGFVEANIQKKDLEASSDEEITERLVAQARVEPLSVDFDDVTKNVDEAKVHVRDFGRDIQVDGVRATRSFRFTGDAQLFRMQPNSFWSVIPYAVVSGNTVTIGIEAPKDSDMIKRELDGQQKLLADYVGSQATQIKSHNDALAGLIGSLVAGRRKHLQEVDDLKDKI